MAHLPDSMLLSPRSKGRLADSELLTEPESPSASALPRSRHRTIRRSHPLLGLPSEIASGEQPPGSVRRIALGDVERRNILGIARLVEAETSMKGTSAHLLAIGRS
jgi:hypothetical protein